jgi:putative peptidoglycan lipid II flippase
MSEKARVIKAAGVVGGATLLSRILGFIRDAVIAWYFGAGFSTDAFIAAFRIPNLLRRLFAEGALSAAFIPVLAEYVVNDDQAEAFRLVRSAFRLSGVILLIVTVAGILLSPWLVSLIAPGFGHGKVLLTILLIRIMFPYLLCIGLMAICMSILNVLGRFAAPALAPVVLNLSIVGSVLFISPGMTEPIIGVAIGVLIGGVLQLGLQLPFLVRINFRFWEKATLMHAGLKKVGFAMFPVAIGGATYQINILIGTLLGSLLSEGSVSYLYFADRLVQFPLGIFAIAAATAVLPSLSRQAAARNLEEIRTTFEHAMKLVFFISMPATVGLIVMREPIVALLFQRGEFNATAAQSTSLAVLYYAAGLWAFSAAKIAAATFFALQDIRTPLWVALISIAANTALGVVLMKPLAHGGLALATSLASMINLMLLVHMLRFRIGYLGWKNIAGSALRALLSAVAMGIVVRAALEFLVPPVSGPFAGLLAGVCASVAIGLCVYALISYFIKSPEFDSIVTEVMKGAGIR